MSLITGSIQLDLIEMLFNFQKTVQNLLVPSFLSTTTIGKLQGDLGDTYYLLLTCHPLPCLQFDVKQKEFCMVLI